MSKPKIKTVTKGKYYDETSSSSSSSSSDVITQKEAWSRIIDSDNFREDLENLITSIENDRDYAVSKEEAKDIRTELKEAWRSNVISSYIGYYLREDGLVEVKNKG